MTFTVYTFMACGTGTSNRAIMQDITKRGPFIELLTVDSDAFVAPGGSEPEIDAPILWALSVNWRKILDEKSLKS